MEEFKPEIGRGEVVPLSKKQSIMKAKTIKSKTHVETHASKPSFPVLLPILYLKSQNISWNRNFRIQPFITVEQIFYDLIKVAKIEAKLGFMLKQERYK